MKFWLYTVWNVLNEIWDIGTKYIKLISMKENTLLMIIILLHFWKHCQNVPLMMEADMNGSYMEIDIIFKIKIEKQLMEWTDIVFLISSLI